MTVGPGFCHKVAFGDIPLVVRPYKQIFATLALVRSGQANVADKAEKGIVTGAQNRPGDLSYYRPIFSDNLCQGIRRR